MSPDDDEDDISPDPEDEIDDGEEGEEAKAAEPEVEEGVGEDAPIPTADEMMAALRWAFEKEEDVSDAYFDACVRHALMVLDMNRRMNLTKIVEAREVAAKHYLDCWRASRLAPLLGKRMLDLGSGAGFPGIPVAMAEPNCHVVLCDSTEKKARFLEHCVAELEIPNVTVINDRAEDHLKTNRYDVVMLRAISSVRENVRLLRRVRHSLIDLIMLKGPSWSREVRAGEREAERLGFHLDTVWEHELPGEMGGRAVLFYRAPGGAGL